MAEEGGHLQAAGEGRHSLTDRVYTALKRQILRRELEPGTLLTEAQLAQGHGVSKTPAREALRRLQQEGLVELVPYSGYLVGRTSVEQARDLLEVRRILEGEAAGLAATRLREEDVPGLRRLARAIYRKGEPDSYAQFCVANRAFHVAVATCSQNALLAQMVGDVLDRLQMALYQDLYASDPTQVAADHAAVVEAVAARDSAAARQAVHAEVDHLRHRLVRSGETPVPS
jgi:DNA-binding GntR family transcriptional regulator